MGQKLTVVLTGQNPVLIDKDEWPVLASVAECDIEEFDEHRQYLCVRRHEDGRTLLYAIHEDNHMRKDGSGRWDGFSVKRGYLYDPGEDFFPNVYAICEEMSDAVSKMPKACQLFPWSEMAAKLFESLPVQEI